MEIGLPFVALFVAIAFECGNKWNTWVHSLRPHRHSFGDRKNFEQPQLFRSWFAMHACMRDALDRNNAKQN